MRTAVVALGLLLSVMLGTPAQAAEADTKPVKVFAVGDSITWGGSPWDRQRTPYPTALAQLCGDDCKVKNVGQPGACLLYEGCGYKETIREVLQRKVWKHHPDTVIVSIGANDLGARLATYDLKAEYRAIRADGAKHGVNVLLATITPGRKFWPEDCEAQRQKLNAWIRTLPHVDFDAALSNNESQMRARFDSGDGVHPSSAGYKRMAVEAWRTMTLR